jgi:hypothetical protein
VPDQRLGNRIGGAVQRIIGERFLRIDYRNPVRRCRRSVPKKRACQNGLVPSYF